MCYSLIEPDKEFAIEKYCMWLVCRIISVCSIKSKVVECILCETLVDPTQWWSYYPDAGCLTQVSNIVKYQMNDPEHIAVSLDYTEKNLHR